MILYETHRFIQPILASVLRTNTYEKVNSVCTVLYRRLSDVFTCIEVHHYIDTLFFFFLRHVNIYTFKLKLSFIFDGLNLLMLHFIERKKMFNSFSIDVRFFEQLFVAQPKLSLRICMFLEINIREPFVLTHRQRIFYGLATNVRKIEYTFFGHFPENVNRNFPSDIFFLRFFKSL